MPTHTLSYDGFSSDADMHQCLFRSWAKWTVHGPVRRSFAIRECGDWVVEHHDGFDGKRDKGADV